MSLLELIKGKTLLNKSTVLLNNYKYLNEEEITKLEEQLLSTYSFNSSINYTNPSYIFPHEIILDKLEKYINTSKKYTRLYYYEFLEKCMAKYLKNDIEKINEELSIHYNALNKLEEKHPETNEIIEKEKNKIKETFQSNTIIIKELEKRIEKNKDSNSKNKIIKKELEFEKLKDQTNEFINKKEKLVDIEENNISKYKYIELVYKLELFFNSKEGEEYISSTVKRMRNIKANILYDDNYNPIQDINRMIKEVEFIDRNIKQARFTDKYSMSEQSLKNEYKYMLKVKFDYLKKHPIEEEIHNLKNDYNADSIYTSFIRDDLERKEINNEIDNRFYNLMTQISASDILYEMDPFIITLYFAYYSDTLEEWFQNKIENTEINFINLDMDYNKIIISSDMSRETYFYLPNNNSLLRELLYIHQELVKKNGLSWPILKGIKEIKLTDNVFSRDILSLFSLSKDITVSKDVKLFALEDIKDLESGNITFQDGIEKINMRNVSFKDEISITIPKSVKYLGIDIVSSNINTLIFEDYDQSYLLNNTYFINSIISQIYNEKSNCFTINNCDYSVSPNSNKTIKLVLKRNNENKEYVFKQIYIFNNKSIHDFNNKELWKQDLIDMARKKVYDAITGELHIKDRVKNISDISLNNITNMSISLPEYGPFLKRNEEELQLMDEIAGAKVLDLGCGAGESLEYLYQKGAKEIWGVDISNEQIERAKKRFPYIKGHFFNSPMEEEIPIPNNYFDYIISIFSIGYTSDIKKTFQNVYKYLNDTGAFIVSWTHPVYNCLGMDNDKVLFNKSYFDESAKIITKGPDKIYLAQKNYMISTIINTAISSGLYVDRLLEEQTIQKDDVNGYNSNYWRKEKTENCPTTLIYRLKKIKNEEK